MTAVKHDYVEGLTAETHTGDTNYVNQDTEANLIRISGGDLEANTKYLIIAEAMVGGNAVNTNFGARVATADDSLIATKSEMIYQPNSATANQLTPFFFAHSFETDAVPADIDFEIKTFDSGDEARIDQQSLKILDLADWGTPNYFETIHADDGSEYPTTQADEFTIAGSNLGTDEFWVVGYQRTGIGSINQNYRVEVHAANDTATSAVRKRDENEGENTAEMRLSGFALRHKASSGTPDLAVQTWEEAASANAVNKGGYAIALKTSTVVSGGFQHDYIAAVRFTIAEATIASIASYLPSVTADHWFFGSATQSLQSGIPQAQLHIENDTVEMRPGDQPIQQANMWDNTAEPFVNVGHQDNIPDTDTSTYDLRAAFGQDISFRWLIIISLEKAAAGPVQRTFTGTLASGDLVGDTIKETRHTLTGLIGGEGMFGDLFKETAKLYEGTIGVAQLTGALSVRLAFFRLMTGLLALADLTGAFGPSKTAKGLSGATTPTGDPQLKIAATYEGATTPAGALTKFSPRAFAGAITVLTGDLIRKTGKPLTGAIATITGALTQRTAKLLEGTIATAAGDLILKTSKLLEGTLTSSGFSNHIIPLFQIAIAGAITSAGAITLKTATLLEGVVSSSAELRRKTAALYEGTIASGDLTGALTNIRKILVTFTGAITTLTGELLRQTQHTPSGAITSSATLTQRIAKLLEGNITPTGFSNHILPLFKIAIGGALTLAGALLRQTQHTETASITPAGQYGPSKIAATYEGTTTQTGDLALTRTIVVALSGALTLAGGLIRKTAARITGTAGSSGTLLRSTATTMTGAITPSGDLRRKTSVIFAAILTLAGALATLVIPPAVAGPITRIIRHQGRAGADIRHQGTTGRKI